jgi:hypothetical protein
MAYLLDANVFIQAKRFHYGFDFCPAFWDWIVEQHEDGKVLSIEKVGVELKAGNDALSEWAAKRGPDFFLPAGADALPALSVVSQWALTQEYTMSAVSAFLSEADYYLVAQALAGGHTVVTMEKAENKKTEIKIPNACMALKVKFMTPFELLRTEKARFILPGG